MMLAYIAIGSNLGDPVAQARLAIQQLTLIPKSRLIAASSLYSSTPMGPQNQPDYINAVAAIETELTPLELLDCTQRIELEQGVSVKANDGDREPSISILCFTAMR